VSGLELSIIIPAFNESGRLVEGFDRVQRAAHEGRLDLARTQVIFVDDGSSDDTAQVAQDITADLPHGVVVRQSPNQGKGAAVRAGVKAATAPRIVFTDADLAIDPRQVPSLLDALDNSPLAVGTRAIGGHVDYGSWLRTRAGRSFNFLVRTLSNISLRDTQCGFKGARIGEAKVLFHFTTINGFAFDVEFLSRARGFGWNVAEVPVSWRDVPGSHVDVVRHSLTMLTDLTRARFRSASLPALLGMDLVEGIDPHAIADATAQTSLMAAPILQGNDGTVTLLAALHSAAEASPALLSLKQTLGSGVVRRVQPKEIAQARGLTCAL